MVAYSSVATRFSFSPNDHGVDVSKFVSISRALTLAPLLLLVIGCASGGAGGNSGGRSFVRMDMGISTNADLARETEDLLRRRQFPVFRTDGPPAPLMESEWRNQTPFEDERELGVTEVRCRILVRGRERPPMGGRSVYQVTYTMETQVKTVSSPDWMEMPMTSERTEMAREFGRELQLALEVVRR